MAYSHCCLVPFEQCKIILTQQFFVITENCCRRLTQSLALSGPQEASNSLELETVYRNAKLRSFQVFCEREQPHTGTPLRVPNSRGFVWHKKSSSSMFRLCSSFMSDRGNFFDLRQPHNIIHILYVYACVNAIFCSHKCGCVSSRKIAAQSSGGCCSLLLCLYVSSNLTVLQSTTRRNVIEQPGDWSLGFSADGSKPDRTALD